MYHTIQNRCSGIRVRAARVYTTTSRNQEQEPRTRPMHNKLGNQRQRGRRKIRAATSPGERKALKGDIARARGEEMSAAHGMEPPRWAP